MDDENKENIESSSAKIVNPDFIRDSLKKSKLQNEEKYLVGVSNFI